MNGTNGGGDTTQGQSTLFDMALNFIAHNRVSRPTFGTAQV